MAAPSLAGPVVDGDALQQRQQLGRLCAPLVRLVDIAAEWAEIVAVQPEVQLPVAQAVVHAGPHMGHQRGLVDHGEVHVLQRQIALLDAVLHAVMPVVDHLPPRFLLQHRCGRLGPPAHLRVQPHAKLHEEARRRAGGRLVGTDQRPHPAVHVAVDEPHLDGVQRCAQLAEDAAHAGRLGFLHDRLHERGAARRHVTAIQRPVPGAWRFEHDVHDAPLPAVAPIGRDGSVALRPATPGGRARQPAASRPRTPAARAGFGPRRPPS